MSKSIMNAAVCLAFGMICCVLLWHPWAPDEEAMGFRSADDEMRALLQRQTEEREASAKAQGSGKEAASKAAPAKSASGKEAQAGMEQGQSAANAEGPGASSGNPPAAGAVGTAGDGGGVPPADASEAPAREERGESAQATGKAAAAKGKINLNSATAAQLDELPGIGASRAQAIVALRQKLGGKFTSVDQLLEVKGIGEKMLAKIAPLVTVEP